MTTFLLDANVLIAVSLAEHEHYARASAWFATQPRVAICPSVEGALLRFLIRLGERPSAAHQVLVALANHPRIEFWPDATSYSDVDLTGLQGHRQVTDLYLIEVARRRNGLLATLDSRLVAERPDDAVLIP